MISVKQRRAKGLYTEKRDNGGVPIASKIAHRLLMWQIHGKILSFTLSRVGHGLLRNKTLIIPHNDGDSAAATDLIVYTSY